MKAKTELLLYQLFWLGEQFARPTFRNLSTSFEAWTYSSGFRRAINRLEQQEYLETQGKSLDRVVRLTDKGRQLFAGDRHPEIEWEREWDGIWRMVMFDIPEANRSLRRELRGILRENHFGCLQQSVWLSPHSMDSINQVIRRAAPGLSSLTLMESRLLPGEENQDVVKGAWDYSKINANYQACIDHMGLFSSNLSSSSLPNADHLFAKEKFLWETALKHDPLLPKKLIPPGYLGRKAWRLRKRKLPKFMASLMKTGK
jgi:phenylacetic acid degradation operon negative regulatory protein